MPRYKKKKPYIIPSGILDHLDEHCKHGWFVFTYDDQNNFRVYSNFDNELIMKALVADIEKYINAFSQLEMGGIIQGMIGEK